MHEFKKRMLSTAAMVPLAMGVTIGAGALLGGTLVTPDVAIAACNPCAAKKACNPCNPCAAKKACNPCAAKKACNPCNPCAAKNPCAAANACNPCNPCAAGACNPCNPCNPCAAGGSNASANCFVPRIKQAAACNPCAAKKACGACNPCAAKKACGACNPCAAKKACNPCNPCAAKKACNPCAAKNACGACNPCAAKKACNPCNPCAAKKACNPCNPCAAKNPCAAANACNPCNPCNPCAAGAAIEVSNEEAAAVYGCLKKEMKVAYKKAKDLYGNRYQTYKVFNKTPYVSATHGGRIVNNYANKFASKVYGKMENIKKMPIGSVLGKDSFTITPTGAAAAGPLFLMEKMVRGWNAETSDWKYTMIMPNGTVFGRTKGKNAAGLGFCHECHVNGEDNDFMLLVPEENRL